jgi:cell division septation protein DedD
MRGSVAEQNGASRGDGGANGARATGGYTLKQNNHGERNRGAGAGWEIRLGVLQVAVWLGLAIGACVGGYFVGFFSGRYVGFEAARQSSSAEIPKLPAPEMFADASAVSPNRVYDKLKEPAILPDSTGPRASAKIDQVAKNIDVPARVQVLDSAEAKRLAGRSGEVEHASSIAANDDEIFGDVPRGEELIIGSDDGFDQGDEDKGPSSVRMLGKKEVPEAPPAKGTAAAAAVVLDERIANARSEAAKAAEKEVAASQEKRIVADALKAEPASVKTSESNNLVRKVLPPGYFAQVSAPKKLSEAESVAKRLKRAGFPVVVESASVKGESFYRVLVGPEENKVQAERLVSQLQSESFVASKPFIRKVSK